MIAISKFPQSAFMGRPSVLSKTPMMCFACNSQEVARSVLTLTTSAFAKQHATGCHCTTCRVSCNCGSCRTFATSTMAKQQHASGCHCATCAVSCNCVSCALKSAAHNEGCACGSCASSAHAPGCGCGSCASAHAPGCACGSCRI